MIERRGRTASALVAAVGLAALLGLAAMAPGRVAALDSDLKGGAIFRVEASNGYSILALASSERADGRGDIALIVHDGHGGAVYGAPATVTPTKVVADLGSLGSVALDVVPSGVKRTLKSSCEGDPVRFEPNSYRGTFEFHGEEGYTGASATVLPEYSRFWLDFGCFSVSFGELGGADLPGARLRLRSRSGPTRLSLQANKNEPRARSRFEVEVHEKRQKIRISRSTQLWAGAAAFDYDPLLRTATLEPPPPFSGRASFRRGAVAANRWSGNLTVDLPGRSDVPLTAAGVRAHLVPSCWRGEGVGRGCGVDRRRPDS